MLLKFKVSNFTLGKVISSAINYVSGNLQEAVPGSILSCPGAKDSK